MILQFAAPGNMHWLDGLRSGPAAAIAITAGKRPLKKERS
jgi:hypothetical protein